MSRIYYILYHKIRVVYFFLNISKTITTLLQNIKVYIQLLLLVFFTCLDSFSVEYPLRELFSYILQLYFLVSKKQETFIRNRLATKPVILKVCNIKLSFDIWLVLYMYFILYVRVTRQRLWRCYGRL